MMYLAKKEKRGRLSIIRILLNDDVILGCETAGTKRMNEVDYMQMKNRCKLRTATGIALFFFYPTNTCHHSTVCNRTTFLRATDGQWEPHLLDRYITLWWPVTTDCPWHSWLCDSSSRYRNHFSRCPDTCAALNDNIRWLTGILLLLLLTHVCFIVPVTFNASPLTSDRSSFNAVLHNTFTADNDSPQEISVRFIVVQLWYALADTTENIIETPDVIVHPSQYLRKRHDSLFSKPPSFAFDGQDDRTVRGHWKYFFSSFADVTPCTNGGCSRRTPGSRRRPNCSDTNPTFYTKGYRAKVQERDGEGKRQERENP